MSQAREEAGPSLLRQGVSGVAWSGAAQVLGQLLHMTLRILLARLLTPAHFGLVAAVMVTVELMMVFSDLSLAPAVVHRRELTEEDRHTAFWMNVGTDALLALVIAGTAPLTARFYGIPSLVPIQVALSACTLLGGPNWILAGFMTRDFRFRVLAFCRIGSILLGGTAGLVAATQGLGVWALVIDLVVRNFTASILLLRGSDYRPRLVFSRRAARELAGFSRPLVGARFLEFTNGNFHFIAIGQILGATALGLFNIGYQFVLIPVLYVARSMDKVLLSGLSRLRDDQERQVSSYLTALELAAFITMPLMTFLALAADLLVPGILGERWREAVPLVQLLSLAGVAQALALLGDTAFQALGRPRLSLQWNLALASGVLVSLAGLPWGTRGVAAAYLAVSLLLAPLNFHWVCRCLGLAWGRLLAALRGVAFSTLLAALAVLAVRRLLPGDFVALHPILAAAVALGAGTAAYLLAASRFAPGVRQALTLALAARRPH